MGELETKMKLHLACGQRNFGTDWIHIDGDYKREHIHSQNITHLPFVHESADLIYCSHAIAYFDRDEILRVLKEWYRVLKTGGILRLATPDFKVLTQLYIDKTITLDQMIGPLYGRWPMGNQTIYHRTTYDFDSLKAVLETVGFKDVKLYDWRETEHAEHDDHSQAYIPHMDKENGTLVSLNVECQK